MRDFERISGISRGYLSMLEKNENPKSKRPIVPSLEKIKQVSNAIHVDVNTLIEMLDDDLEISLSEKESEGECDKDSYGDLRLSKNNLASQFGESFIKRYFSLDSYGQEMVSCVLDREEIRCIQQGTIVNPNEYKMPTDEDFEQIGQEIRSCMKDTPNLHVINRVNQDMQKQQMKKRK